MIFIQPQHEKVAHPRQYNQVHAELSNCFHTITGKLPPKKRPCKPPYKDDENNYPFTQVKTRILGEFSRKESKATSKLVKL